MMVESKNSVFKDLEDYDGLQVLCDIYNRIRKDQKHCQMVIPEHIASFCCADVFLLIDEEDFIYFEDLLDEKEFLHNKYIRFISKTNKYDDFEEIIRKGGKVYDI